MAVSKPTHVLLFKNDYKRISDWVSQYPDRETGGQFFGLWTYQKNPYINVVIGPGVDCRHETHSFHQDIAYLKKVGEKLNKEFMMCHIGEWHSHHRLRLRQPSSGDLNSIWKHFPEGIEYFLLVIATIESDGVNIWPWIFSAATRKHERIGVKIIEKENVFLKDDNITDVIGKGAEQRVVPYKQFAGERKVAKVVAKEVVGKINVAEKKEPWFLTEKGALLVQYLNSELEKIADKPDIDKVLAKKTPPVLQLSFLRHGCKYIILFPENFPTSCASVICSPPQCTQPVTCQVQMQGHSPESFVYNIVECIKRYLNVHVERPSRRSTVV